MVELGGETIDSLKGEAERRQRRFVIEHTRALAGAALVAVAVAALTGLLRTWIWVVALEPAAIGVIIGEAAAVPSSARHRRPPRWSYLYIFTLGCLAYALVHVFFWLVSGGVTDPGSLVAFLRDAPSGASVALWQNAEAASETGGAAPSSSLKYWLWVAEGGLMGLSASMAYRGGSVRKLKT